MSVPERISVLIRNGAVHLPNGSGWKPHDFTPYILATPEALAAAPEVQRLIAEAVAREREACARTVRTTLSVYTGTVVSTLRREAVQAIRNRKETT